MLNNLKSPKTKQSKKRIGRGYGSAKGGHTVGRGQKGQKSRAGYSRPRPDFAGGAMPLSRRIPKLPGFSRGFLTAKKKFITLSLTDLDKQFNEGDEVTLEVLNEKGLTGTKSKSVVVKILNNGEISKKLTVKGLSVSKGARAAIEKAGGQIE